LKSLLKVKKYRVSRIAQTTAGRIDNLNTLCLCCLLLAKK